jgi:hypothetical protein
MGVEQAALRRRDGDRPGRALAQAVPEKVIACGFDTTTVGVLSRLGDRGWSVYLPSGPAPVPGDGG